MVLWATVHSNSAHASLVEARAQASSCCGESLVYLVDVNALKDFLWAGHFFFWMFVHELWSGRDFCDSDCFRFSEGFGVRTSSDIGLEGPRELDAETVVGSDASPERRWLAVDVFVADGRQFSSGKSLVGCTRSVGIFPELNRECRKFENFVKFLTGTQGSWNVGLQGTA